ncbi:MAG TPA: LysM domain-containing protein [Gemmatimonadales bacterium]|nr:LysM domain-containing protein [Gemmatimonadales bacterium]
MTRRTTICRSERSLLLALAALSLVVPVARAQDTTHVKDSTAAAAPAPAPAQTPAQMPATHTVAPGETLWSLAQQFFGDPLLWPEIYRLNTNIIQDPHWIYPGEELTLGGNSTVAQGQDTAQTVAQGQNPPPADTVHADTTHPDTVAAKPETTAVAETALVAPPPPPPPAVESGYRTIFDQGETSTQEATSVLRAYANQPYRPLRRGEFYSAGFLTEKQDLPWATLLGTTATPSITRLSARNTAGMYDEVAIKPPDDASYHVGDSLMVARLDRAVNDWGAVVVPTGVVRITAIQPKQVLATVIMQFGRMSNGQVLLPVEPFHDPGEVRPAAIERGLEARVITQQGRHDLAGAQQIFFLDKGRTDGVASGDIFEVYRPSSGRVGEGSEEVLATLMVVRTRDHSSSALVIGISNPQIPSGAPARLIKKMPS